jgi:hypothetical protein
MSMTYLTSLAMLAVGHDMLNDTSKRSLLERDALTASLIDRLDGVHKDLAILTREDGELQARIQEISEELRACDQVHDRMARGIYRALESAADLAQTAEEGRPFIETRDLLFPDALSINTLSFREQSGNVIKVAKRATPSVRAVLSRVELNGRTLEACFDEWVDNGERMGKLVAERASLSGDDDTTRVSAGDLREVRTRWIRIMNMLLSTLDLIEMPEPDRRRLLANLREAESAATRARAAEQRRRNGQAPGEPAGNGSVLADPVPTPEQPVDDVLVVTPPAAPVVDAEVEDLV